jgi:hypothetical protein
MQMPYIGIIALESCYLLFNSSSHFFIQEYILVLTILIVTKSIKIHYKIQPSLLFKEGKELFNDTCTIKDTI